MGVGARAAVLAGAMVAIVCLPVSAAAAQERSWRIEDFHADIRVSESGSIEVTETIRPRFEGRYNGIHRTILVEYRTNGFRYKL